MFGRAEEVESFPLYEFKLISNDFADDQADFKMIFECSRSLNSSSSFNADGKRRNTAAEQRR